MRAAVRAKARPTCSTTAAWGRPIVDHCAELEAALERLVAAAPATPR